MRIPAEPFDFELEPKCAALLIIDMQRDFLEPGGFGETLGNDVSLLRPTVPVVSALLQVFRDSGLCVVHTREGHLPDLSDCPRAKRERGNPTLRIGDDGPMGRILIRGEPGHAIINELAPREGEVVIDKPGKGAFYATDLTAQLEQRAIRQLVVTGVTTEVCVQTTLREANDRGYECLLVEDGTASYFPAFKQSALEMVRAQGAIVGWTCSSSALQHAFATRLEPR